MNFDPWKLFFIIMTNLMAILFIYLYFKHFNKSKLHVKKPDFHKAFDKDSKFFNKQSTCPFMAAFTQAKKMENFKKNSESSDQNLNVIKTNVKYTDKNLSNETKMNKEINIQNELFSHTNNQKISFQNTESSEKKDLQPNSQVDSSTKTNNESIESISKEKIKTNIVSSMKKVTSPEDIKSFYEHIPAHVKQLEQEKLMMTLKPEEREEEVRVRQSQLEQIYKLMGEKSELFGISSFDDIHDQMKLYVQ